MPVETLKVTEIVSGTFRTGIHICTPARLMFFLYHMLHVTPVSRARGEEREQTEGKMGLPGGQREEGIAV